MGYPITAMQMLVDHRSNIQRTNDSAISRSFTEGLVGRPKATLDSFIPGILFSVSMKLSMNTRGSTGPIHIPLMIPVFGALDWGV